MLLSGGIHEDITDEKVFFFTQTDGFMVFCLSRILEIPRSAARRFLSLCLWIGIFP